MSFAGGRAFPRISSLFMFCGVYLSVCVKMTTDYGNLVRLFYLNLSRNLNRNLNGKADRHRIGIKKPWNNRSNDSRPSDWLLTPRCCRWSASWDGDSRHRRHNSRRTIGHIFAGPIYTEYSNTGAPEVVLRWDSRWAWVLEGCTPPTRAGSDGGTGFLTRNGMLF